MYISMFVRIVVCVCVFLCLWVVGRAAIFALCLKSGNAYPNTWASRAADTTSTVLCAASWEW